MDYAQIVSFFMWCTIINGGLLVLWSIFLLAAPDLVYRIQNRFIPMPRETFNVVIYSFVGLFKLLFLIFNLIPYIALLIVGG